MEIFVVLVILITVNGFLIDDNLQQYKRYGRTLVLSGGNLDENNTEVYEAIVQLAGGINRAKLGIVIAAADDPKASCDYYSDLFLHRYHVLSTYCIPVTINDTSGNSDNQVVGKIKQQSGIFFAGGDPERVIKTFYLDNHSPSPVLLAIKDRFNAGVSVSGTSAGTECQPSSVMIRGPGTSYSAFRYGTFTKEDINHTDYMLYNGYGGIGMLDGFILDAHFSQKGREGRLIRLLSDTRHDLHGVDWGIGIDENTALVITHIGTEQEQAQVIGYHGVFVVDVSHSYVNNRYSSFNINNVIAHYLTHGDKMFLKNKTIIFSSSKTKMLGTERIEHAVSSDDVFGRGIHHQPRKPEFVKVATSIFDAKQDTDSFGDTREINPKFRVYMSRASNGAEGYVERGRSPDSDIIAYTNLQVRITEI